MLVKLPKTQKIIVLLFSELWNLESEHNHLKFNVYYTTPTLVNTDDIKRKDKYFVVDIKEVRRNIKQEEGYKDLIIHIFGDSIDAEEHYGKTITAFEVTRYGIPILKKKLNETFVFDNLLLNLVPYYQLQISDFMYPELLNMDKKVG